MFGLDGALVRQVPIDQADLTTSDNPDTGLMWAPHGEVRDGRVLLSRLPRPGTLELVVLDLTTGRLVGEPVAAVLPPVPMPADLYDDARGWPRPESSTHLPHSGMSLPPAGVTEDGRFHRTPVPEAWLHDGAVLVNSGRWGWVAGFVVPAGHYLVDLSTGHLRPVELPVPTAYGIVKVGDAAGLSPRARQSVITIR